MTENPRPYRVVCWIRVLALSAPDARAKTIGLLAQGKAVPARALTVGQAERLDG